MRNYRRFLRDAAKGMAWRLDDYGRYIAGDVVNTTDMELEDFKDTLKAIQQPRRKPPDRDVC